LQFYALKQPTSRMAENQNFCYVCCDEDSEEETFRPCTKCPNFFHLDCFVPALKKAPEMDAGCLLCQDKDYFDSLPNKQTSSSGNLTKRELQLGRRMLLEMYGIEDQATGKRAAKPFREMEFLNFKTYKMFIKKPIALDRIKDKLEKDHPNQYDSIKAFLHDCRRMFINCRTYWGINYTPTHNSAQSGTIYTKYASLLEKTLNAKMTELMWSHAEEADDYNNNRKKDKKRKYE